MQNKKHKYLFKDAHYIYKHGHKFDEFKSICNQLDEINHALYECIPEEYAQFCHFGSIDYNKNIIVLFILEQQIFHIMRSMNDHILQHLARHNFNFDAILFKIKYHKEPRQQEVKYKQLDAMTKEKLTILANLINKPELVLDVMVATPDPDELFI